MSLERKRGGGQEFVYRNATNVEHCVIILVIIGAIGIVTDGLEAIPGKHSVDSLQKTAIVGTSHILQSETYSLSCRNHRWFMRNAR